MAKAVPREEIVADNLLDLAVEFTNSKYFTSNVDKFIYENVHIFRNNESKSSDSELPHAYNLLFIKYQEIIDGMFEEFAERNGFSISAVYTCFRDSGLYQTSIQYLIDIMLILSNCSLFFVF